MVHSLIFVKTVDVLILMTFTALVGFLIVPLVIKFLYKFEFWRKEARTKTITGDNATVFNQLHKEREVRVPRAAGMIVFLSVLATTLFFYFLPYFCSNFWCAQLNFLSRSQVVLPLFALIVGGLLGFADDFSQISGRGKYIAGGLTFKQRLFVILLIGLVGGWWFCFKLGWTIIGIPFLGNFDIGLFYFPLFIVALLAVWSGGIIDGIDGLAGGVFMIIFSAYGSIAFAQHQYDLAAFCAIITASLLPFLWYNIPPAKFYMGETGTIALTATLTVVAFLTNAIVVLPIIAGLLLFDSLSVILQLISKKIRKKKIWLCTPIHHHFEAIGWAPFQVTMRFWIIGAILAIMGVIIQLVGKL
ncbi:MAG: hypothetical protein Q8O39_00035 [bacterium]|nr:hypothetical protein [bacterium]